MDSKKLISSSVDALCYIFNIKLYLCLYFLLTALVTVSSLILFWNMPSEVVKALHTNIAVAIGYLPITFYYIIKLIKLIRNHNTYIFSTACLCEYKKVGFNFAFSVRVGNESGNGITRNTNSIFTTRSSITQFDKWHNKNVIIAYDPNTEKVIVCREK